MHKITVQNHYYSEVPTREAVGYEGKDPMVAQHEYNRLHGALTSLMPGERIVSCCWWVDGRLDQAASHVRQPEEKAS